MSDIRTFEDLECWKACREFRLFIMREVVAKLPRDERFELNQQLKRAVRSVTANIAEGYGRFHYRENYKFCSNARGSLYEVLDHLITAGDENLIPRETLATARLHLSSAVLLLNGYMKYLMRAGASVHEDAPDYPATPIRVRSRARGKNAPITNNE
jgi:four helix bundle protein